MAVKSSDAGANQGYVQFYADFVKQGLGFKIIAAIEDKVGALRRDKLGGVFISYFLIDDVNINIGIKGAQVFSGACGFALSGLICTVHGLAVEVRDIYPVVVDYGDMANASTGQIGERCAP